MLSPEQEKQVEEIKAIFGTPEFSRSPIGKLLAIVDDLRKQLPKQLNGGEVMAECFRAYEVKYSYDDFAAGWLAAFIRMGAIKE